MSHRSLARRLSVRCALLAALAAIASLYAAGACSPFGASGGENLADTSPLPDGSPAETSSPDLDAAPVCPPGIDALTSREHCGACGHSCDGAECVAGLCAPVLFASGLSAPVGIALSATDVFVVEDRSSIRKKAKVDPGGNMSKVATTSAAWYASVAGEFVYWGTDPSVKRASLSGSDVTTLTPAPAVSSILGIVVGSNAVFFTDRKTNTVLSMPLAGGATSTLVTTITYPEGLALDEAEGSLYVASNDSGVVHRHRLGGADAALPFDDGLDGPAGLAVDDKYVYIAEQYKGRLWRKEKTGSTARELLADDHPMATGIAVDGKHVYWTNVNAGEVWRMVK